MLQDSWFSNPSCRIPLSFHYNLHFSKCILWCLQRFSPQTFPLHQMRSVYHFIWSFVWALQLWRTNERLMCAAKVTSAKTVDLPWIKQHMRKRHWDVTTHQEPHLSQVMAHWRGGQGPYTHSCRIVFLLYSLN